MEWIKCADCMPPSATDVLCYRSDGHPPIVAGLFHGEFMSEETGRQVRGEVTHWMPLPALPKPDRTGA